MDSLLREIREIRENLAKQYNYDVHLLFQGLRDSEERERAKGGIFVSFPPRAPRLMPVPLEKRQTTDECLPCDSSMPTVS